MYVAQILILTLVFSCAKKKESEGSGGKEVAGTHLALAEASPNESLEISSQVMETFDEAIEATAGSIVLELSQGALLEDEGEGGEDEIVYGSKWCNTVGDPMASPGEEGDVYVSSGEGENTNSDGSIQRTHPNFAARKFHCMMKIDSFSSDTIRGSYSMMKAIVCELERLGVVDFDNPGTSDVEIEIEAGECFSEKAAESLSEGGEQSSVTAKITTKVLDDDKWQKEILIEDMVMGGEATDQSVRFQFANTTEGMGIRFAEDYGSSDKQTAWAFSLTSSGKLSYERKSWSNESDNGLVGFSLSTTSTRIFSEGKVDVSIKDGDVSSAFSEVNKLEGTYVLVETHPDDSSIFSGSIATIAGNSDAGFETRALNCNNDGAQLNCDATDLSTWNDATATNVANGERSCFPAESDCKDVEAIEFEAGDEDFLMVVPTLDDLVKAPNDWVMGLKGPLEFDGVSKEFLQD